ncbi:hypothetical protein EUX98_g6653 [Antrodiella citrinella]|uniref:SH3 domain-containing protein n=1 Tax=Antrodiella citrinella TaxID=2447956 RepID=A0A4V3XI24_9APHY|nr:hypothetical protein EUX98_g6653 [Antrodiella citrinella]
MAAVAGITIKGTNPVGVAQKTNVLAQEARVVAQSTNNARENLKGAEGVCAVVQYDYEAQDDNELTLLEGQLIEQIDFIDDGWWAGIDPNGKTGIFPANYVELVDERLASSTGRFASSAPSPTDKGMVGIALYIYDAAEDNEISFQEGDRITEIEAVSEDWWQGKDKHGGIGLFPANYVELQV